MKRIYLTAGTLLLGTSAMAWAPSSAPVAHSDKAPTAAVDPGAKAPGTMLVAKANDLPKADRQAAKLGPASASWIADDQTLDETAATATATATTELTPHAAAGNYPACRPGPGDDNCIQLYEPGVRAQLASWTQPTGGLANGETAVAQADTATMAGMGGPDEPIADETAVAQADTAATMTGMGGPYEPIADETADSAMNGDGSVDAAIGETATDEAAPATGG